MRDLSITELSPEAVDLAAQVLGADVVPPPPFWLWAQSLGLAAHVEPLGAYCRHESKLSKRVRELSVLLVGRHWRSPFAWWAHYDDAIEAGVPREALDRLARGDEPGFDAADEDVAWRFSQALLVTHAVPDALFAEAREVLGDEGLMDLIGCFGSFSMSAWALNTFQAGMEESTPWPFPDTPPVRP
ncbi:carboxymuconolactone decarboxylase family protein [Demequina sp. NBRC 110051]|uniref:carboxymuconolactone decarboxylase family protein n=1 Tax=Demequina sp. NBRC 110051 TaxID=1570340 RepID=UPI000A003E7D|nr:hypothetical protein [Demequina sp. NBRC 110051]